MDFFKGVISNCKKEVLTHTSGEIKIEETKIESKRNLWPFWDVRVEGGGGGGGGKITTTHEHYTDFEIDGVAFRCYGDLTFKDSDKVRLYGVKTDKGYYYVVLIQNFTRDFYVGEKPANPDITTTINKKEYGILSCVFWGAFAGAFFGIFIGLFVAFTAWGFYDAQFWKTFKITWLISTIVAPIIIISIRIIPKSESAKQREKQQEERELNRRKEAWTMYQKVINDDE